MPPTLLLVAVYSGRESAVSHATRVEVADDHEAPARNSASVVGGTRTGGDSHGIGPSVRAYRDRSQVAVQVAESGGIGVRSVGRLPRRFGVGNGLHVRTAGLD